MCAVAGRQGGNETAGGLWEETSGRRTGRGRVAGSGRLVARHCGVAGAWCCGLGRRVPRRLRSEGCDVRSKGSGHHTRRCITLRRTARGIRGTHTAGLVRPRGSPITPLTQAACRELQPPLSPWGRPTVACHLQSPVPHPQPPLRRLSNGLTRSPYPSPSSVSGCSFYILVLPPLLPNPARAPPR
eukprot:scaffold11154_cov101-Isochrysis_galbana.AAC.5